MLGLGDHRTVLRDRVQRWLCEPGEDAAWAGYFGGLRPTEERNGEVARPGADVARRESGRWTRLTSARFRLRLKTRQGTRAQPPGSTAGGWRGRPSATSSACRVSGGAASLRRSEWRFSLG